MKSSARTPKTYLDGLPAERRGAIAKVRSVILKNLPEGYVETVDFGMLAYVVPLRLCPETYNGHPLMYAALASQKQYMSVYLMNIYGDAATAAWFRAEYKKSGKKLDAGKSCIRFKTLDELPLELIGQAIARVPVKKYLQIYQASRKR